MTPSERFNDYLKMLRTPFQKLCRLRFLQPDGSTAFAIDNNPNVSKSMAFIAEGSVSENWQNGRRRSASVTLDNAGGEYEYNVNNVWFGTEIALDEGLVLSDGTPFYLPQGIFLAEEPGETLNPVGKTAQYTLVDKAANLDGGLFGNLTGTYEVQVGTNIFEPIAALLNLDRGNGMPVDRVAPVFTEYYNGKTQTLPDGTTVPVTNAPYTLTVDRDGGTYWGVISGLAEMLNAWVGYDETGALRVDPSQDDILDADKPVLWEFSLRDATILGAAYTVKNTEVYNDYIVVGDQMSDYSQPAGRAQNMDPSSPTNVQTIGRKTIIETAAGYATATQCRDKAEWMLKRSSVLQRAVSISCSQLMHIRCNELVTLMRTDKAGSPTERHLIQSFSRPLAGTGQMTITATSVNDFPIATVTQYP